MREIYEFRIFERLACEWLEASDGVRDKTGHLVRIVRTELGTPCFDRIMRAEFALRKTGEWFYGSWNILRRYSHAELSAAELFHVKVRCTFEPAGEELDVTYLRSSCPAELDNRIGPLILKCSRVRGKSLCRSIAGEVVIAPEMIRDIKTSSLTGAEGSPLLCKSGTITGWSEFHFSSSRLRLSSLTSVGRNPFSERSPLRSDANIEINVLSELYVNRESWDGSDFAVSDQVIGVRKGIVRPERFIFMSRRAYNSLTHEVKRGLTFEIAHLV